MKPFCRKNIHCLITCLLAVCVAVSCRKDDHLDSQSLNEQQLVSVPIHDTLTGVITGNTFLTNNHTWYIKGWLYVTNEALLKVEHGTNMKIIPNENIKQGAGIIVTRGSKLLMNGLPDAPISLHVDDDDCLSWAGIILLGRAPTDRKYAFLENDTILNCNSLSYGGNLADDSSGVMEHVRIDFIPVPHAALPPGLILSGTGSRTVVKDVVLNPVGKKKPDLKFKKD
jgi:hypothetical protein